MFTKEMCVHLAPMHPVIAIGPFVKCGVDFKTWDPSLDLGHMYIIVAVDYFMKWVEAMPTFGNDGKTMIFFRFNHIIARFGVPKEIVRDHSSYFLNTMIIEL